MPKRSHPDSFPLRVTVGNATVKIYKVATGKDGAWTAYTVADYSSGRRVLRKFADLADAKSEAHRIAIALANGDAAAAAVDYKDAAALVRCRGLLDGLDVTLETAVELFAEAARAVGPHRVVEAAKQHAKRFPVPTAPLPIADAADEYFAALESRSRSERHLADVRARLARLISDFPGSHLGDLTTRNLQAWVDGLKSTDGKPLAALSKRNFASVVSSFLNYHRRRGRIADNPAADLERPTARKSADVDFWSAEEAARLLDAIAPDARPAFAVALFCGCRTAEITRLARRDFDFAEGHVAVGADKAKTASRRLVPLPENLRRWLGAFVDAPASTPLWPSGRSDALTRAVTEACEAAKVRRVENGARHAFITHRVAATGDVARVALEAGNSASVIFSHYRGIVSPQAGKRFFEV